MCDLKSKVFNHLFIWDEIGMTLLRKLSLSFTFEVKTFVKSHVYKIKVN